MTFPDLDLDPGLGLDPGLDLNLDLDLDLGLDGLGRWVGSGLAFHAFR